MIIKNKSKKYDFTKRLFMIAQVREILKSHMVD